MKPTTRTRRVVQRRDGPSLNLERNTRPAERDYDDIVVRRLEPDPDEDFQTVLSVVSDLLTSGVPHFFVNPLVAVTCHEPSLPFRQEANRWRQQWLRQCRQTFGRQALKNVRAWRDRNPQLSKVEAYLHRQQCVTGMLLIDHLLVESKVLSNPEQFCELLAGRARSSS